MEVSSLTSSIEEIEARVHPENRRYSLLPPYIPDRPPWVITITTQRELIVVHLPSSSFHRGVFVLPYSAIFSRRKYFVDWLPQTFRGNNFHGSIRYPRPFVRTTQTASSQTKLRQYTCRPRTVSTTPCSAGSAARFPTSAFPQG